MKSKINWDDYAFRMEVKKSSASALEKMAEFLTNDIKKSMQPGNYRPWPSKKRDGSIHWSSSPGDPPAPDTEALQDSVSYAVSDGSTGGLGAKAEYPNVGTPSAATNETKAIVGTQDPKGLWMEMGVQENNVAPRPFLRVAIGRNRGELKRIYIDEMKIE